MNMARKLLIEKRLHKNTKDSILLHRSHYWFHVFLLKWLLVMISMDFYS